ncbi:MAG: carboxypeptidase-like regulatory domain-containing protein [Acidobacteriia bacterium]|nr:carboxypeptidase-like regulatory domain-containing protein [Terriglobia bacterium]
MDSRPLGNDSLVAQLSLALLVAIPFLFVGAPAASAQVDRAVLEGTVTDASGSVIIAAAVKVLAVDTGLSEDQPTNSKGVLPFSWAGSREVHRHDDGQRL